MLTFQRLGTKLTIWEALEAFAGANDLSVKNALVEMREFCRNSDGELVECPGGLRTITFAPVDTMLEAEGDFNQSATVWRTDEEVFPGRTYFLSVQLADEDSFRVQANATIPDPPSIFDPRDSILRQGGGNDYQREELDFGRDVEIEYQPNPSVQGRETVPGTAFEVRAFLTYSLIEGGDTLPQEPVLFGPVGPIMGNEGCTSNAANCFRFNAGSVPALWDLRMADGNRYYQASRWDGKLLRSASVEITALDSSLTDFLRVNDPAVVDFTTVKPQFTNIRADPAGGAVGIFGSVSVERVFVRISPCTEFLAGLNGTQQPITCEAP